MELTLKIMKSAPACIAVMSLISFSGCYAEKIVPDDGNHQDDPIDQTIPEIVENVPDPMEILPDVQADTQPVDPFNDCSTGPGHVLSASVDTSGCTATPPFVVFSISEVSVFCEEPTSWDHIIVWTGPTSFEITPNIITCGNEGHFCDPGASNVPLVTVVLPGPGNYTATVAGMEIPFTCATSGCASVPSYLSGLQPADGREYRLYGQREDIDFIAEYASGFCGCSEFGPVPLSNPAYGDEHYYSAAPTATVCFDDCCEDCACIDTGTSNHVLATTGTNDAFEVVFNGSTRDIRGFIAHEIANPFSECWSFPLTVTAVNSPTVDWSFDPTEPIEMDVTVAYAAYPSPSCCEVHTDVAYDLVSLPDEDNIGLFAFGGTCLYCDAFPCPESDTLRLIIPPGVLDLGFYSVGDALTGYIYYSFSIVEGG